MKMFSGSVIVSERFVGLDPEVVCDVRLKSQILILVRIFENIKQNSFFLEPPCTSSCPRGSGVDLLTCAAPWGLDVKFPQEARFFSSVYLLSRRSSGRMPEHRAARSILSCGHPIHAETAGRSTDTLTRVPATILFSYTPFGYLVNVSN